MKTSLFRVVAGLVVCLIGSSTAKAQLTAEQACCRGDVTYISVFSGFVGLEDQNSVGFERDLDIDYDGGFNLGFAVGRDFEGPLRIEGEFTYRNNNASEVVFNGTPQALVDGDINSYALMLNLYADGEMWGGRVRPYIGGGIGFAFTNASVQYGGLPAMLNGEDSSFAFQGMAGVTTSLTDRIDLFVEYRFFGADTPRLNRFGGPPINGGAQNLILESEYISHGVTAGARILRW